MGCCDRARRAAATVATAQTPSSRADLRAPQPPRLHYVGHRAVEIRGRVTGRTYRFDPEHRTQTVDFRDALGLLRTKLFRQA